MPTQNILIRDETKDDPAVITEVTAAAFETLEISSNTEQFIIEALRSANALTLSLVAEVDGRVVGHIAFSPLTISDGAENWYGLGPVSVLPMYQRMGIGKAFDSRRIIPIENPWRQRLLPGRTSGILPEIWV